MRQSQIAERQQRNRALAAEDRTPRCPICKRALKGGPHPLARVGRRGRQHVTGLVAGQWPRYCSEDCLLEGLSRG